MAHCWELRGCYKDIEMVERCPHNSPGANCPGDCHFAICDRPTHKVTTDFDLLLRGDLDYEAPVKDVCKSCEFFLKNGPTLKEQ